MQTFAFVLALLGLAPAALAGTPPSGFTDTPVLTGLGQPTAIAFASPVHDDGLDHYGRRRALHVLASKSGCSFTPSSRNVTLSGNSVAGQFSQSGGCC